MFGFDMTMILFVALATLSVAALAYGLLAPRMEAERQVGRRLHAASQADSERSSNKVARDRVTEAAKRRKSIEDTLADLEKRQRERGFGNKKPPLKTQIKQAGMTLSTQQLTLMSVASGVVAFILMLFLGVPLLVATGGAVVMAIGAPRWFIAFKRARRVKLFLEEFPNALDVIVRAVKSGLPLNDAVRMIASESPEPVRSEFRRVVEQQQLGMSLPEATMRMQETMPCAEASFFGIVIQIQSQAGGNLSEALGNLSKVLRDRKKMKAKINALSMEAKASAVIIGALPFIVALLVYISSPGYIMPLFTTDTGHLILMISGVWMAMGIFVMRKMINFDF